MLQLVHDLLRSTARQLPERVAVRCGDRALKYAEFDSASERLAAGLRQLGVARGDRVVLLMDSSIELAIAIFGVLKAGGVFVVLHPTTKDRKLHYVLNDCAARVLIAQGHLAPVVASAAARAAVRCAVCWSGQPSSTAPAGPRLAELLNAPPADSDSIKLIDADLAAIIYTSGSTGEPKGVMLTHRNMVNTAWAISTYLENTPDDVVLCVLPLSFDYGLYQLLTAARVGFSVVLEQSFAYPQQILKRAAECRVTGLPGVPTLFATLLQMTAFNQGNLPSLRYLTNTAAPLPPAHIRQLQARLPNAKVYSMYGLTECTRVSYVPPDRLLEKITSVGIPMPNCEAYVVDEHGRRAAPGAVGELVVRGANVMRGYWRKPAETAHCLRRGEIEGEPVLYSGDLFYADEEGFLYFVGRRDDVFKCKGEKVSPREVEAVLCELDGVAQAAVVGVPDAVDGLAILAYIVPQAGFTLSDQSVRKHCRTMLESHLVPKHVQFCETLPTTDSGKVRKRSLRELSASSADGV